jgi:hypothetical protein
MPQRLVLVYLVTVYIKDWEALENNDILKEVTFMHRLGDVLMCIGMDALQVHPWRSHRQCSPWGEL